jgi:hypothetical protein
MTEIQQFIRIPSVSGSNPGDRARKRRQPLGGKGPLITIAITLAVLVIGIRSSPETTEEVQPLRPGPITSLEDVAGIYFRHGVGEPMYFLFFEDGTVHISSNTELLVDHPMGVFETTFAGTEALITQTRLRFHCNRPDQGGTYRIHVLENGNLQFTAVGEDTCLGRSGILLGLRYGVVTAEFEPVCRFPDNRWWRCDST